MKLTHLLRVEEESGVGEARRLSAALAHSLGFDDARAGEAAIVATELATNLVKHANGGELIFRTLGAEGVAGLEVLSLDKGPGIRNIGECFRNGHSTSGSPGTGLGAIRRLSTDFDLFSAPGRGVALLSRLWCHRPPPSPVEMGVICLPVTGETACGDAWAARVLADRGLFMVADGLGHGSFAAEASGEAVKVFEAHAAEGPADLLEKADVALRGTRGAAVAFAELLWGRGVVRFAGVGNICGRILAGGSARHLVSQNGTAGLEALRIREYTYPWPPDGVLILHSDGIAIHWNLDEYPGLPGKHPALLAGVLYRDYNRSRDDSTVVVIGMKRSSP